MRSTLSRLQRGSRVGTEKRKKGKPRGIAAAGLEGEQLVLSGPAGRYPPHKLQVLRARHVQAAALAQGLELPGERDCVIYACD